jgi:CheY-like chemotaxis protein
MNFENTGLAVSPEFLKAALLVSLLSVWSLVGLFYYLNRYTRQDHFNIWTGAWTFYAVWLTLGLGVGETAPGSLLFTVNQVCVSISAALLLWGCLRFLGIPVPRRLSTVIALFLGIWILATPQLVSNTLEAHLPVFVLLGLSSPFAGISLLRLQRQNKMLGIGMLSLGLLLWLIYLGSYPFPREVGGIFGVGFCVAAAYQLFIAVSMIVLLYHEMREESDQIRAEIEAVRQEKEALKAKVNNTKEACQNLVERQRAQQAAAEREHLQALGQMTGDVAHDMNNALSPITAYAELLLCTLPDLTEVQRERLQRISSAAENLAQIVAHMREFYRLSPGAEPAAPDATLAPPRPLDPDLPPRDETVVCRSLRILCIDDEPLLRELMHDVLELKQHRVTVAKDGNEGLALFRSSLKTKQPFEVVITDLGMPDLDGRHVARAVKAESPKTPVIMLTGWGTMMKKDGFDTAEVDAVLGKPPRIQELSNLLFQITGQGQN